MKNIAIVCDVMKNDVIKISGEKGLCNVDFVFLEQYLHNTPDLMREKLQEEIDKVGDDYEKIILGYGLCSNGVTNLVSKNHEIIIPKVDDCISLFLGSKERYLEEFKKDPATYYFCKGWIEYGGDPYRGYLTWTGKEDKIPKEWLRSAERYGTKKYEESVARFLVQDLLRNYKRILLINNDDIEDIHRKFIAEMIDFLNEVLERKLILEEVKGSSKFLEKLLSSDWDQTNFLKIEPGQKILQELFFK